MRILRRIGEIALVASAVAVDVVAWGGDDALRFGGSLPIWVAPAATIATYSIVPLRWSKPISVFGIQWSYSLIAGIFVPQFQPFAGLLIALHAVARTQTWRVSGLALAACIVPFGLYSYDAGITNSHRTPVLVATAAAVALWGAVSTAVWGLGRAANGADRRAERAREARAAEAVRLERLRLARELHDIVSHAVSGMLLQAAGAKTLVRADDLAIRSSLEVIEGAGVQAMKELHRLLGLLRATDAESEPAEAAQPPTLRDLSDLVTGARAAGVDVETVVEGCPAELDASVDLTGYRTVQEALTNVIKHGGRGAAAGIHLVWEERGLTMTVRSTGGSGSHPRRKELSSGYGLLGLEERVALVGGNLAYGQVDGSFLVRTRLPLCSQTVPVAPSQP